VAYASVADVQAKVLSSVLTIGPGSEPSDATVTAWLESSSAWMDAALAWKYVVPVTDPEDVALLRPICAAFVAAQVFETLETTPRQLPINQTLNLTSLALYDAAIFQFSFQPGQTKNFLSGVGARSMPRDSNRIGRSFLVLRNTPLADSGEAAQRTPLSTFCDPEPCGSWGRLFGVRQEF
jgi:hypothetical protein